MDNEYLKFIIIQNKYFDRNVCKNEFFIINYVIQNIQNETDGSLLSITILERCKILNW